MDISITYTKLFLHGLKRTVLACIAGSITRPLNVQETLLITLPHPVTLEPNKWSSGRLLKAQSIPNVIDSRPYLAPDGST